MGLVVYVLKKERERLPQIRWAVHVTLTYSQGRCGIRVVHRLTVEIIFVPPPAHHTLNEQRG